MPDSNILFLKPKTMIMHYTILAILFSISYLGAEEPRTLSFHRLEGLPDHLSQQSAIHHLQRELTPYHEHTVQIRGFLYKGEDDRWILSPEPKLKSCCIGSAEKVTQQISVTGNIDNPPSIQAVTVQGQFVIVPAWDSSGNLIQLYRLEKASVLADKFPTTTLALASLGILSVAILWRLSRKKNSVS